MPTCLTKHHIIGESPVMQDLAQWIEAAAPEWDTILITGERGTGKELLAKAIHRLGPTQYNQLAILDCAALHASTAESTLFGHERGAFTGAVNRHIGILEAAHNSTLFMDEISTLSLDLQSRFLRFLEEGTIQRVGSNCMKKIKTRIIAATNRNLEHDVSLGLFLPDLLDRLNVLHVVSPPLRERENDRFLLMKQFLGKGYLSRIDTTAKETLRDYTFPGNIRELKHLCRRLSIFNKTGAITTQDIQRHLYRTIHSSTQLGLELNQSL